MENMEFDKNRVFVFLDGLRNSGKINMFGAAPYVERCFPVSRKEARELVLEWMDTFDERHPA